MSSVIKANKMFSWHSFWARLAFTSRILSTGVGPEKCPLVRGQACLSKEYVVQTQTYSYQGSLQKFHSICLFTHIVTVLSLDSGHFYGVRKLKLCAFRVKSTTFNLEYSSRTVLWIRDDYRLSLTFTSIVSLLTKAVSKATGDLHVY